MPDFLQILENVPFLVIGIVGLVVLIIAFVIDGIFDAFDIGGDGPLSLTSIAAFFTVFGFAGLVASRLGADGTWAAFIGAIVGLMGGAFSWLIMRWLKNSDSNDELSNNTLLTLNGVVKIPTGPNTYGEIVIYYNGQNITYSAISDEPILAGTKVSIESILTANSVKIAPFQQNEPESK